MSKYFIGDSPTGKFTAFYMSDAYNVTIYSRDHKMWKYTLDENGTLSDLDEIINGHETAAADIHWLIGILQTVETHLEFAEHDIAKYGELNVTY